MTISGEQLAKIMEQAQVFASAWSLAGGPFDGGDGTAVAEQERLALRTLIQQAAQKGDEG